MLLIATMNKKVVLSFIFAVLMCAFLVVGAVPAYALSAVDPFAEKQEYLRHIRAHEAWDIARENQDITIAIVDTGIDLDHPDLKPNLVKGVNLLRPGVPPQDDNGHGTNVAGVIGAVGNNDRGITGLLWKAKIMPIKALDANGEGGEQKLGEGIKYAVDNGAKIVVLSLGLNKYSDYMREIVEYAEERDVLLVAAVGNEGSSVQYPAAYPTVLAVGGVTRDLLPDSRSSAGPEVDVVAPWDVFTTALGGGYEHKDGTSMAAPQVAAAAALAWSLNPELKAAEIRGLVRQTALNIHEDGWSPATGFGLLQVDKMLESSFVADMYEPNHRKDLAKAISVNQQIRAVFAGGGDVDWFYFDAPYDGTVQLTLNMTSGMTASIQHNDASGVFTTTTAQPGKPVKLQVRKGRSYLQLQLADRRVTQDVPYQLTTDFTIYKDPFEENDKSYQAYVLPSKSQTIKGTFHQHNDIDWYLFPAPASGSLRIWVYPDTTRMDLVLYVQKQGERTHIVDNHGDGKTEMLFLPEIFPGNFLIRVSNVEEYSNPIVGEYTLQIEYDARLVDPNEPNNRSYQATPVQLDKTYGGLIDKVSDIDWFQVRLTEESLANFSVEDIPESVVMNMQLYDGNMKSIAGVSNRSDETSVSWSSLLKPGTYYIRLTANEAFTNRMYQLLVTAKPLTGGFVDIRGHWAADAIMKLSGNQLLKGYSDYTFRPDQPITRAEVAAVLTRYLKLNSSKEIRYSDVPSTHWAYDAIAKAAQAGIVDGYPDGSFAPDQPVTRMEMAAMLARGKKLADTGVSGINLPFIDIDEGYWGTPFLKQIVAKGWINGYPDGTFRPDRQATRAEWVALISQLD